MSAGEQFKALYDFKATGDGMLSFKIGDRFTLVSKSNVDWWVMRSPSGERGLVPVNYVGACEVRPEGAITKSAAYKALYDYSAQNESQLSFKQGEVLYLVDKTDVSWWSMHSKSSGGTGLVPVNYIDKLDTDKEQTAGEHLDGHTPSSQTNGGMDDQALNEVLKSIDSNIQRIHEAAAAQGSFYTSDQRAMLEKLVAHRQTVVDSSHAHPSPTHSQSNNIQNHVEKQRHHTVSGSLSSGRSNGSAQVRTQVTSSPTKTSSSSLATSPNLGRRTLSTSANSSPRPRRHAPPPPMGVVPANVGGASLSRKNKSKLSTKDNRYSLQVDLGDLHERQQPNFGSLPRRSGPAPPTRKESAPETSSSTSGQSSSLSKPPLHPSVSLGNGVSLHEARQAGYSSFVNPHENTSSMLQPASVLSRRYSSDATPNSNQLATPPELRRTSAGQSTPALNSPSSPQRRQQPETQQTTTSDSRHYQSMGSTGSQSSIHNTAATNSRQRSNSNRSSSSPASPVKDRSRSTSKEREYLHDRSGGGATSAVGPPPIVKLDLPTNFSHSDGMELVEAVRKRTGVSHRKSLVAINEVLEFLKNRVPLCGEMVDALLSAVQETQQVQAQMSPSAQRKMENTSDVERLKEIFFEITECKDDSQQRGWAVHDDQHAIMEILEELLQILCDANPDATKLVVQEDKYENILTLITYYQMESRVPLRLLLLKVFGVLCGLDTTVISILLSSVLPNELGRDIQQGLTDIQKTLYSSTVSTMIYSTAEAVPLPVYDQWSEDYVLFLLDTIENPPDEDEEEQVPDAFLNMILSFNQHFQDPSTNLVMAALKQRPNPRNFSEKLMFLVNRGEDPVAIAEPCCPDSMTKFLLDVFYDSSTSSMFYTTDLMVLIDIVTRQLTDLSQGDEVRTHNLELLYRLVGSTPYSEHKHRQSALSAALNRISHEEGIEGTKDLELVKKIRSTYPGLFEEVTDL